MKNGRVVHLPTQHAFGANTLKRIEAQQGFHDVDRGGYTSDALRVLPGSVPEEVMERLYVVWIDRGKERIAKVEKVRRVAESEYDLLLGPFGEFEQTGPGGPIIDVGVHLLLGPVHHKPEYRARTGSMDRGSYKPHHFTPHST